jgi:hypothetical protein
MRVRVAFAALIAVVIILGVLLWRAERNPVTDTRQEASGASSNTGPAPSGKPSPALSENGATRIHAHNLLLRRGPSFRVYIRWLEGRMAATTRSEPSFDDPNSFVLDINNGILRANIGDIGNFLNASLKNSTLSNVKLEGEGDHLKLTGTVRKVIPIPVEIIAVPSAEPDSRIRIHVTKINVLKLPMKWLLSKLSVNLDDFIPKGMAGLTVTGNEILVDTQVLLPPPHLRGSLTKVRVAFPDLEEVYGKGEETVTAVDQWRNFLSLKGGTINFGRLSMHPVDIIMIDISKDAWFNMDLAQYQSQLVNGYTRMTPEAGMQIFMPDLRDIQTNQANKNISMQWLKNRNQPPPPEITTRH